MPPQRNRVRPAIRRILVTAGPTREMLDPVRFIANLSTGEMGYAIAREARRRGFVVTLISGPTSLKSPRRVRLIPIVTVEELGRAMRKYFYWSDVLVMAAAVGDFIPVKRALKKIPRQKTWKVLFRQSPDLVRQMAQRKKGRIVIGFSLETENWLERSRSKREAKNLDGVVANYFSSRHNPFGRTKVHVALIDAQGVRILRSPSKPALAQSIINWIIALSRTRKYNK